MKRSKFILTSAVLAFVYPCTAFAQWAVYDEEVKKQLIYINNVTRVTNELNQKFKSELATASSGQDLKLGVGSSLTNLKGLDTKFETLTDLSDAEKRKYIETDQDCGSNAVTVIKHYNACVGLRNLRLQTMKQSQALLKTLDQRRQQIVSLVTTSRGENKESGQMQRYHFELQALQALMQTDAMQLQVVMDGYKQREKTYEMQMVEAKRERDTGRFDAGKGALRKPSVPFVMPPS